MSTEKLTTNANPSLPAGAVIAISAVIVAGMIVAVSALGTTLLGVPTTYGNGVDSRLGAQVIRDFLADQDAEAAALSSGDQSLLGGHFSDSALGDVIQQISNQSASGTPPKVGFQPASLTVLRTSDPSDPNLTIEVREDGTKSVVSNNGPDQAPSEQSINFHGDFWLRIPSGSHYAIADQHIETAPSSPLPALALAAAAVLLVGLAAPLVIRRRGPRTTLEPAPVGQTTLAAAPAEMQADEALLRAGQPAEMVISTFGGLHIREGGKDWAQELMSRPVTGFVWLRLLVAAIRDPAAPLSREEVARQASPPGLRRDVQLKHLRNVVAKGLPDMPSVLRDRILVQPKAMRFTLEGCEVDAIELLKLSTALVHRTDLSTTQATRIHRMLSECQGAFLPEFETMENFATDRHPTCAELLRELREMLTIGRVELALLLASTYLRSGRPAQAITILEPARVDRPQRKDIADRLAAAYRGVGREAEAKAVEARHTEAQR